MCVLGLLEGVELESIEVFAVSRIDVSQRRNDVAFFCCFFLLLVPSTKSNNGALKATQSANAIDAFINRWVNMPRPR